MVVFFNGEFVPEGRARISAFDRGFLYGDGLFETVRVYRGKLFEWEAHWERFWRGVEYLQIPLKYSCAELRRVAEQLIEHNVADEAVVRLNLSRGTGPRGYSPRNTGASTLLASVHPIELDPQSWTLATTSFRLAPPSALSAFKTASKLTHVAARGEADNRGADEGLLLSPEGGVGQGTASNIFWIDNTTVSTPPLTTGILPGVTRAIVLELCAQLRITVREHSCAVDALNQMTGIFLTLSSYGIVQVSEVDSVRIQPSAVTQRIREAYYARTASGV